ncbi:hypothetical protein ACOSQ4_006663 [Xanthoceras sorbifolium]
MEMVVVKPVVFESHGFKMGTVGLGKPFVSGDGDISSIHGTYKGILLTLDDTRDGLIFVDSVTKECPQDGISLDKNVVAGQSETIVGSKRGRWKRLREKAWFSIRLLLRLHPEANVVEKNCRDWSHPG